MMYNVELETTESVRLVSDTRGTFWERVWRWTAWTRETTHEAACATVADIRAGQSKYVRGVRIIEEPEPVACPIDGRPATGDGECPKCGRVLA